MQDPIYCKTPKLTMFDACSVLGCVFNVCLSPPLYASRPGPVGAVEKEVAAIALRSWDWLPHANLEAVMGLIILCLIIF